MLFLFFSTGSVFAGSHLQRPYELKATSSKQYVTLTWKCRAKNAKYKIYRKTSGDYKYLKTVKVKHDMVHINRTSSFAVMTVKGSRSSNLSDPVMVRC